MVSYLPLGYEWVLDNTSNKKVKYPPYDLIRYKDNTMFIRLAVAGYDKDSLSVTIEGDLITVVGDKQEDSDTIYLHRGISKKNFEIGFRLEKYLVVKDVTYRNGILSIEIEEVIPDELKPRTLEINYDS